MAIDDHSVLPSEVVSFSTPADASSSRWRRFKNWGASQWARHPSRSRSAPGGRLGHPDGRGDYSITVISPPFKEKFTNLAMIDDAGYNQDWEAVFQTVRAPLPAFQPAGNSKVFDPAKLRIVRLKFDRTPMYKICISSIGFAKQ